MTRDEVIALHHSYIKEVLSLDQAGARVHLSRERVRQLFVRYGLPTRSAGWVSKARRGEAIKDAEERREEIIALYKEHGTIPAVARAAKLPPHWVAKVIDSIPDREAYKKRGKPPAYSEETLKGHLHIAASNLGQPLSRAAYRDFARGSGLASDLTIAKRFGSFQAALEEAGIAGHPRLGRRPSSLTPDDCIGALEMCIKDNGGGWVSVGAYDAWAEGKSVPSAISIRSVFGLWSEAVQEALGRLAQV